MGELDDSIYKVTYEVDNIGNYEEDFTSVRQQTFDWLNKQDLIVMPFMAGDKEYGYPGPSAKKGIYGVLINIGELEDWVTVHASTVKVTTPYDNTVTIMHEGASGGGKSEMIEELHREADGRVLFTTNTITSEKLYLEVGDEAYDKGAAILSDFF